MREPAHLPKPPSAATTEHTTAVSMLDRLLHHATTVVTNGQSYRMRQARQRQGGEHISQ